MWLGGQQKRPPERAEGQRGTVTMDTGELAVLVDSERRGMEIYGPAGYRWTPRVGQQVLVIHGKGESPCVAGVRQDGSTPKEVQIQADKLVLKGQIWINGMTLEDYIATVASAKG